MTPIDPDPAIRPIPLVDLRGQYGRIRGEVDAAVQRVLASQSFVHGEEVESFEREFAAYCRTEYAVGCGSGTDALTLSLMALGIGPGDEVLCPAYSFVATATSILSLGARPVFCDIAPDSYRVGSTPDCHTHRGTCHHLPLLAAHETDAIVCSGIGHRALTALREAGIEVLAAPAGTVAGVVRAVRNGSARPLPTHQACGGGHGHQHRDHSHHGSGRCGHHEPHESVETAPVMEDNPDE